MYRLFRRLNSFEMVVVQARQKQASHSRNIPVQAQKSWAPASRPPAPQQSGPVITFLEGQQQGVAWEQARIVCRYGLVEWTQTFLRWVVWGLSVGELCMFPTVGFSSAHSSRQSCHGVELSTRQDRKKVFYVCLKSYSFLQARISIWSRKRASLEQQALCRLACTMNVRIPAIHHQAKAWGTYFRRTDSHTLRLAC